MRLPKRLPAVGRVFGYWRAERRTIRHGLVSLVVATVGEVGAGIALGAMTGTLQQLPGLLILLPAANSIRGSIFGAMSSRLGTSIHTGMFERSRRREGALYQNIYSATVLTFSVSLLMGIFAKIVAVAFGVTSITVVDLVVVSVLGGVLSSALVGALAVVLALAAHSYRWDLDSVATPVITAIGDLVTIPALYAATFAIRIDYVTPTVFAVITAFTLFMTARGLLSRLPQARRAVRESLPLLAATGSLSLMAGLVVESRIEKFVTFPAFLVLIPALLSNTGALGAMLSSRLASKLHLGAIEPKGLPEGLALLDSSIVLLFGLWVFVLVAVCAHYASVALGFASPGLLSMVEVGLIAGLLTTAVLVILAYYVAVATYRLGLDPDNHGVPLVTSASDLLAVLALIVALVLLGLA
jgi:mgtE-like transporter